MLDSQKLRGPWRITFDTNPDQCNIHCIMCEEHSKYNRNKNKEIRIMDFDIIQKVIEESVNYGLKEVIPSTMGEPLLYKRFLSLIELIRKNDLRLNLTTNGTFPKLRVEKWAKLILPIASDIKVSINGVSKCTNESIMEGINPEAQLANIEVLLQVRDEIIENGINNPTITFQVTFMSRNLMELPDLLLKAIEMNLDRFKGHHVWITHPQIEKEFLKRNKEEITKWNLTVQKLHEIAEKYRLKNGSKIRLENVYPITSTNLSKIPDKFKCPFLDQEAWIAWDGTFNVCCAPNQLRKSFGHFGNVKDVSFMKLWDSSRYNQLIENWGNHEVCKICNMRRPIKNN